MSGFAGILNRDDRPVDRRLLESMTASMAAVAPDGQNIRVSGSIGLGHALLQSTFESRRERQPHSFDEQTWVVGDARIDDRDRIIRALRNAGRSVDADAPDPEIILHAYHAWGEDCIAHLIGDFAFAIWDERRQTLFCARDHFGVVPLFYAETSEGLVFSNVLNALRLHPRISDRLNERAIGDFLLFNMNMALDTTTFSDIARLPPAHTLTWNKGALRLRRYWVLPEPDAHVRLNPAEQIERFRSLFTQAVADRLRTDRVGTQMSGGMDSTSVSVTAKQVLVARGTPFDLRAYTIVYQWLINEAEGEYSTAVAAHAAIAVEQLVAEEFITEEPDPTPSWISPEPAAIANQTAEHEILRRISGFSRTMLTGFGGDPLFAYRRSPWTVSMTRGRLDEVVRDLWWSLMLFGDAPAPGVRTALRRRLVSPAARPPLPAWVEEDFARRVNLQARADEVYQMRGSMKDINLLMSPYWTNLFTWMHPAFHGFPVRVVVPFFDLRLALHVATVPPVPWRMKKRLLREAMRGLLPEVVRQRPKKLLYPASGPSDSRNPWYKLSSRTEQQRWRNDLIATPEIAPYLNIKRVRSFFESPRSEGPGAVPNMCLPLAYWLRHRRRSAAALEKGD